MIPGERHMECAYYFDFGRLCHSVPKRTAWSAELTARSAVLHCGQNTLLAFEIGVGIAGPKLISSRA